MLYTLLGVWLARHQGLPIITSPFRTEQEVELFRKLLPRFESKQGSVNYEGLARAFNGRAVKLVRKSNSEWEQLVNLKTVKHMKEFCDKLRKRICLAKSCADWLEQLKAVRRSLRDGTFCSWAPAEDMRVRRAGEEPSPSSSPMLETFKSTADSIRSIFTKPEQKARVRQPKTCRGCGQQPIFAPRGASSEDRAKWHTSYGWCPNMQAFVTGGVCPECKKTRADDSENHTANGFCKTMGRFPQGRRGKGKQ